MTTRESEGNPGAIDVLVGLYMPVFVPMSLYPFQEPASTQQSSLISSVETGQPNPVVHPPLQIAESSLSPSTF